MKKLLLQFVLIVLLNLTATAQENWSWVNPLPQGNDLRNVFVLDENTIFAVGDRGTLLRSENGGEDWEITYRLSNIEEDIVDIQFVSDQKGYLLANKFQLDNYGNLIYSSSKVLLTEDVGVNWKVIADFDSLCLNDLFFIDENIGWVIGFKEELNLFTGIILKTTNSGYNWDTTYVEDVTDFSIIQFIDSENGWAAGISFGSSELLKTTDGGKNWSTIYDPLYYVTSFQFLNTDIGWLSERGPCWAGCGWCIKKTTDGGLSWEDILSGFTSFMEFDFLYPIYFINPDTGWVKERSKIHKTTDGGLNWSTITVNAQSHGAIHFSNELNGCVVDNNGGILTTDDGGQSWIERSTMTIGYNLLAIHFYNQNIGWATGWDTYIDGEDIGVSGHISATCDGGSSWVQKLRIPHMGNDNAKINDVQSITDQIVYAVGPYVYKTTNGGINWSNDLGFGKYNTLYFLNADTGFVGSDIIYKTINGGTEWDTVLSITNESSIESIFFTNDNIGWATVADRFLGGSNIYKTIDDGDTWQEIAETDHDDLYSIYFTDENVGLAVGKHYRFASENYGVIIRTTDGGYNWEEIFNLDEYEFRSACFIDSNSAVVVGQGEGDGIILSIDDVGGNCTINQQSWTRELNDVYFLNNNTGWAVGNAGTIIKTGGGVSFIEEEEIEEIPTDYHLSNNFPNPFNPSTKIRYSVPQTSYVIIKVFDILGKEIETFVNEEKLVGNYEITWYAKNLPSGVYFYQLQAGNFVETKKMVLMK